MFKENVQNAAIIDELRPVLSRYAKERNEAGNSAISASACCGKKRRLRQLAAASSSYGLPFQTGKSEHLYNAEAFNKFENLAMLWSIGKDSTVLLWLARKAFFGRMPFPLVHVDTTYKIPSMIEYATASCANGSSNWWSARTRPSSAAE